MGTEYVVISDPEVTTVVSEGAMGPQGQPGDNDSPAFTGPVTFTLLGTENILVDARTNPREITLGVFRINHTAGITGTRPFTLDINANGYHTKALVIDYKATGLGAGSTHLHEINVDTSNSTAGSCHAFAVGKSGSGLIEVSALEVYPDVHPLLQKTGDPVPLTQAWLYSGAAFTDSTAAFNNGSNVTLFVNDDDYVYCGADAAFSQLEIYLATFASNTISAVFQYSTGPGTWQTFSPADGTNGFTTNGSISWASSLAGWVAATVNSVSKFYIRIQRTRNLLTTSPVEQNIRIISSTDFGWDKNGDVTLHALKMTGVPVYADRTAALAGGLVTNQVYKTSAGALMIV